MGGSLESWTGIGSFAQGFDGVHRAHSTKGIDRWSNMREGKHPVSHSPVHKKPGRAGIAGAVGFSRPLAVLTLSLNVERIADRQLRHSLIESTCLLRDL